MDLWTVVLQTVAKQNSTGQHPYRVRALTEAEAVERAREAHRTKYPRATGRIKVAEVVLWATVA